MTRRTQRAAALVCAALGAVALLATAGPALAAAPHGPAAPQKTSHALGSVPLFVKSANPDALTQEAQLTATGDTADAAALAKVLATPQAVWLSGGTAAEVRKTVQQTIAKATVQKTVPVFIAYNIPGRDCSQYSAGGASTTADYEAWIDQLAAGIGNAKAAVLVEPDGLGLLPQSDCIATHGLDPATYPYTDAERFAEFDYAVDTLEARPNTSVYLDATHAGWANVGDISSRLVQAGVNKAQGFFTNVSNYQFTTNSTYYGTWISDCIALLGAGTAPADCPNQYWNGGPSTNWNGTALDQFSRWQATDASQLSTYTGAVDERYASALAAAGVQPTAHFVIDTSRNATGPNDMQAYAAAPYTQPANVISALVAGNWCNPTGAGIGATPTTHTGVPLVDAYLWAKTPGESDGSCDATGGARAWDYGAYAQPGWPTDAAGRSHFDPLWGQVDPAAGAWFPAQVLDLIKNADPAL
jgi:endoglucanase